MLVAPKVEIMAGSQLITNWFLDVFWGVFEFEPNARSANYNCFS